MRRTSYCTIEDCDFYALGGNGVYLAGENLKNRISYNKFAYVGSNRVALLGTREARPFDFNLHPDSPALKLGFQPIDMTKIGIQLKNDRVT